MGPRTVIEEVFQSAFAGGDRLLKPPFAEVQNTDTVERKDKAERVNDCLSNLDHRLTCPRRRTR